MVTTAWLIWSVCRFACTQAHDTPQPALTVTRSTIVATPLEQSGPSARTPLDPAVIKAVDPLYPGFAEILERDDPDGVVRLARVLSDHPSPESLAVLLWMLRHCPSWANDGTLEIDKTIRAVGRLPLGPLTDALLHASAAQRLFATALLATHGNLIPNNEKPLLDEALVAALKDPNDRVRGMAVAALQGRDSEEAANAVREYVAPEGSPKPRQPKPVDAGQFPAATIALLESLDPDYQKTLATLNDAAVRRLLAALQRSRGRAGTPVLVWLLANGDTSAYVSNVVYQLSQQEHAMHLPFAEVADMLRVAEPERQVLIAELYANVFRRTQAMSPADRDRVIAALIGCLKVSRVALRTKAVEALGQVGAVEAIGPVVRLLDEPDGDLYQMAGVQAFGMIATRDTLPTLERLARSGATRLIREAAVSAYITVAKPADPAAQVRRLLWEQPDTALEKRVLAEGKAAIPAVWQALTAGTAEERRAAAALLGWFRDTRSIRPILAALDAAPGALVREQLLFDLNMILLTEAPEAGRDDRNPLATLHLQWLYGELIGPHIDSDIRNTMLAPKTIQVFPDRITAPLSVTLAGTTTAVSSTSSEAFLDAVRKTQCGVAFHAITAANGVGRVASTVYLPNGRVANQVWISLYRKDGDHWVPLRVPSHPVLHRMSNEPNLMPTINRNYGPDHPLKVLRLDLTMERIRVDLKASEYLRTENRDNPGSGELDASYLGLLERYKRSASPSVKYTAEFESTRLSKQPNLDLWIDALARQAGTPIQALAVGVIASYVAPGFKTGDGQLTGPERDELVTAALAPEPVDPRLVPAPMPSRDNIKAAQRSTRFGVVKVAYGSGPRGQSGYAMLFERRDNRWVFLCVILSWIS